MANVIEIAWFAGLMEGDGTFQMAQNGSKNKSSVTPRMRISMLDRDIIERAAKILKSTITTYPTPKGNKMMFSASSAKASIVEPLLKSMYPYMGERRKEQINKMLTYYNNRRLPSQMSNTLL